MNNNSYLWQGMRLGPVAIQRIVAAVPESKWDTVTEPDRFTFREAVAHIADWEPILLGRMVQAVNEPGSFVPNRDETERAVEMGYETWDPVEQAQKFVEEREKTILFLKSIGPEDWSKFVDHPEKGRIDVNDQANTLLGHDTYHIEHLLQYLA